MCWEVFVQSPASQTQEPLVNTAAVHKKQTKQMLGWLMWTCCVYRYPNVTHMQIGSVFAIIARPLPTVPCMAVLVNRRVRNNS